MEHGGHLPPNCALTVYYLPVYPPYSDYDYGLRCGRRDEGGGVGVGGGGESADQVLYRQYYKLFVKKLILKTIHLLWR
jgi:hypothetical protein